MAKKLAKAGQTFTQIMFILPQKYLFFRFSLQTDSIGEIPNVGIYSKMFNFARRMRIYDITC